MATNSPASLIRRIFSFLPEAGGHLELRREKVALVVFGMRLGEPAGVRGERWFGLRNGDRLSGRLLLPDPVPLKSIPEHAPIGWAEVATLTFPKTTSAQARLVLRTDETPRHYQRG